MGRRYFLETARGCPEHTTNLRAAWQIQAKGCETLKNSARAPREI
jgi:hypothetical protein